jgi:hypothetical protein
LRPPRDRPAAALIRETESTDVPAIIDALLTI